MDNKPTQAQKSTIKRAIDLGHLVDYERGFQGEYYAQPRVLDALTRMGFLYRNAIKDCWHASLMGETYVAGYTEENIVALMKDRAILHFTYWVHPEEGRWLREVHIEWRKLYYRLPKQYRSIAKIISKRDDIREAYIGGNSENRRDYHTIYEYVSKPTPQWVTEQWYSPISQGE